MSNSGDELSFMFSASVENLAEKWCRTFHVDHVPVYRAHRTSLIGVLSYRPCSCFQRMPKETTHICVEAARTPIHAFVPNDLPAKYVFQLNSFKCSCPNNPANG